MNCSSSHRPEPDDVRKEISNGNNLAVVRLIESEKSAHGKILKKGVQLVAGNGPVSDVRTAHRTYLHLQMNPSAVIAQFQTIHPGFQRNPCLGFRRFLIS